MSRRVRIYLANIAVFLDAFMIRHAHRIPGVVSGGVFYRDHLPFFSVVMWAAPEAYVLHVARLEVVLDRR